MQRNQQLYQYTFQKVPLCMCHKVRMGEGHVKFMGKYWKTLRPTQRIKT